MSQGRATRSGSSSDITLDAIRILINESNKEVKEFLSSKIESVCVKVSLLTSKITDLEETITCLRKANESQQREIDLLKESMKNFDPEMLLKECEQRQYRSSNILVFGLPEKTTGSLQERKEFDENEMEKLIEFLKLEEVEIEKCHRIGKPIRDGQRMLKMRVESVDTKKEILRKSKLLKDSPFSNVFLRPDLTPLQQEARKRIQKELKERRESGEDVVIYKGRIQKKSDLPNFRL